MRNIKRKQRLTLYGKSEKNGSFTVEASLLFPFICFLLAVFVQTALYLHDASIFVSAAYEAAQKTAVLRDRSQKEMELFAVGETEMLLEHRRLACSAYRAEAQVTAGKVRVAIEGSTDFFQGFSFCAEKEVLRINPVDSLRDRKKIRDLQGRLQS